MTKSLLLMCALVVSTGFAKITERIIKDDNFNMSATANAMITEGSNLNFNGAGDRPSNAIPGQCFAKVIIPAKFKTVTETMQASPESTRLSTVPAKYGYETKKVLVKEASETLMTIPAKYKTVSKKVLVSPETTEWKRGDNGRGTSGVAYSNGSTTLNRVSNGTSGNEALCLVKKPAVYKTVYEKVEVEPARTVSKPIPAVYKTVRVQRMLEPPRTVEHRIPAKFQKLTKRVKVSDSRTEWAQIICKTNANYSTISKVQSALKKAGFHSGATDGQLGNSTATAIERFQRSNGLPTGGLTFDTIKALGINL